MTTYSLSSTRRKRPYLYGLCKTLYCGVLFGWVLLGGLVACTQAERATPPSTENNPQGFASRIAENTRAFLRALPDRRGKPTAYDSAQEAKSGFFQTPKTDDGRVRIGLLLPSGAEDETVQAIATSLLNAAQLALFDINQPAITLLIKDTKGTENGAIEAAQRAIQEGAKLLIGPVFGTSAKAIAPLAKKANVPVLTFSNDRKIAQSGLWVIGFLPEQNLDRIIAEARAQGLVRFAALIPQTPYGERIEAALRPIITRYSGELVQVEYYQEQAQSMFDPVQRLAHYESRKQAWAEEQERLYKEAELLVPEDTPPETLLETLAEFDPIMKAELDALALTETFGELPYDAVLMPEGGIKLRSLAPLLPYFDVDPRQIRFLGTGLWDDPALGQEPPLIGGWYAAPDPSTWRNFTKRFEQIFGYTPPRLASLAYDSISLAAALIAIDEKNPFTHALLTNADGFAGIDGIFRLTEDGLNERGLAVLEIRRKRAHIISKAPKSFVPLDRARLYAPNFAN